MLDKYLRGRSQFVRISNSASFDGVISTTLDLTKGVPQGSILGPILSSIYTSQLPTRISYSNVQIYADDTQIYKSFYGIGLWISFIGLWILLIKI